MRTTCAILRIIHGGLSGEPWKTEMGKHGWCPSKEPWASSSTPCQGHLTSQTPAPSTVSEYYDPAETRLPWRCKDTLSGRDAAVLERTTAVPVPAGMSALVLTVLVSAFGLSSAPVPLVLPAPASANKPSEVGASQSYPPTESFFGVGTCALCLLRTAR